MFETEKSRNDFLVALKAGKIAPPILQKAIANVAAFAPCTMDEISWTLSHGQPLVQQFGGAVLGVIDDPGKLPFLMEQFKRERSPQRIEQLAQSLADANSPDLGTQLSHMINDKDIESRQKAMAVLVNMPDWARQKAMVHALLSDPKPQVSETMLKHVIRTAPKLYMKALKQGASHPNDELRTLCLKTLVSMNHVSLADVLIQRMAFETGELQKSLYGALVMLIKQDPAAMTDQVVSALASSEAQVRGVALNLLTRLPDQMAAFKRMLAFCGSIMAMARDELFSEMARSADAWVEHIMATFKSEKDPAIRLQNMTLAKALRHPKLAPIFLHEMKNPDWMVSYAAMQVLGDMKSQQALPALVEALNNDVTAMAAIQALDKFRDIRLAKPFLQRLPNAGETEQMELLKALLNLNDARLLPNMAKFLDGPTLKGKARKAGADTVIALCKATNTRVPERVMQIHESLREKSVSDLPDLGLRLSD